MAEPRRSRVTWRRERDLNSREPCGSTRFPSVRTRPLCDPSVYLLYFCYSRCFLFRSEFTLDLFQRAEAPGADLERGRAKTLGDEIEEISPAGMTITMTDVLASRRSASANVTNLAHMK
jgi:hypothetical protein